MKHRRPTQHIRRYISGRWTCVNRGIKYSGIGFTGTRKGMTHQQKEVVNALLTHKAPPEVHHGDAIGADTDFHNIAASKGIRIIIHPPSDPKLRVFNKADKIMLVKPYLDRNKDIVNESDELIATPGEDYERLRSGTWSTIRYAKKLGKPILIINPSGNINETP